MKRPTEAEDIQLYNWIYDRKWTRGFSWTQISLSLGLSLSIDAMYRRYRYLCDKLKLPYKPEKVKPIEKKKPSMNIDKPPSIDTDWSKKTDLEIYRTDYGIIPPTGLVSDLSLDDWVDKYIVYDYFTQDPELIAELKKRWRTEYLSKLRKMVWEAVELLVLLPRGYGKTQSVLALFVKWFLEIREPLYIVSPSSNHSKNILRLVVRMLNNPVIRRDYGDVMDKPSFDKEMMTLSYNKVINYIQFDPPLSIVTWGGAKEGVHPAWIHFEDVMQSEYKSPESNEDIRIKYNNTFAMMRTMRGKNITKLTVTGTRYGLEDMYSYFRDERKFPVLYERALEDDLKTWLYCPNFTLDYLLKERKTDVAAFETKRNNNPVPSTGLYFEKEHWVSTEQDLLNPLIYGVNYYIAVDPGRGFSTGADNTAIVVVGIYDGKAYIVDGYVGKIDDDEKVNKLNALYIKYNPVHTIIEKTFAQIDMNRFNHLRGIIPYQDTTINAKIMRISAMKKQYRDGLIIARKGIQPYDFLKNEYLSYNELKSTTSRHDDVIDALSMIIQLFGKYLALYNETITDWSKMPDFHITPH